MTKTQDLGGCVEFVDREAKCKGHPWREVLMVVHIHCSL